MGLAATDTHGPSGVRDADGRLKVVIDAGAVEFVSVDADADGENVVVEAVEGSEIRVLSYGLSAGAAGSFSILDGEAIAPVDEEQTITVADATAGTWVPSFGEEAGDPVDFDATGAELSTILEAITTIGAGNVSVAGDGPYVVTFQGDLAETDVELIEVDGAELVDGTVEAEETTKGVAEYVPAVLAVIATAENGFYSFAGSGGSPGVQTSAGEALVLSCSAGLDLTGHLAYTEA